MYHAHNRKWEKRNDRRNKTAKSRKNQNAWRKGKLQAIKNSRRRLDQTSGDELNIRKEYLRRTRQLFETNRL